jgi:hypothetical protein
MKKSDRFVQEILAVCEGFSNENLSDYEINKGLGEALALGVVMPLIGGDCYVTKKDATKTIKAWTDGVYGTAVGLYEFKAKQIKKG